MNRGCLLPAAGSGGWVGAERAQPACHAGGEWRVLSYLPNHSHEISPAPCSYGFHGTSYKYLTQQVRAAACAAEGGMKTRTVPQRLATHRSWEPPPLPCRCPPLLACRARVALDVVRQLPVPPARPACPAGRPHAGQA